MDLYNACVMHGLLRHVNCYDQDLKCFARHLTWGWQPIVFTEFKAGFNGWCFTSYIYSLVTRLACTSSAWVCSHLLFYLVLLLSWKWKRLVNKQKSVNVLHSLLEKIFFTVFLKKVSNSSP